MSGQKSIHFNSEGCLKLYIVIFKQHFSYHDFQTLQSFQSNLFRFLCVIVFLITLIHVFHELPHFLLSGGFHSFPICHCPHSIHACTILIFWYQFCHLYWYILIISHSLIFNPILQHVDSTFFSIQFPWLIIFPADIL